MIRKGNISAIKKQSHLKGGERMEGRLSLIGRGDCTNLNRNIITKNGLPELKPFIRISECISTDS